MTLKVDVFDVPPPGAGFVTSMSALVLIARSEAGMRTTNCDELRNAVARGDPFHSPTELCTNPEPDTKTSRSGEPAEALDGESDERVGDGLF